MGFLVVKDHVKRSVKTWPRLHNINFIHQSYHMGYNSLSMSSSRRVWSKVYELCINYKLQQS